MKHRFWPVRTPIGIDIGAHHVKAMQLACTRHGWRIEAAALFAQQRTDAPIDSAMVGRISEILARQGFQGHDVVLAVPSRSLEVDVLELPPRSSGAPLEQIARVELARAAKQQPEAIESAIWDLPEPARASGAAHVMGVAVPGREADALLDAFEAEGMNVLALDVQACAIARACLTHAQVALSVSAMLDIGWNAALLVLVHRGVVVYQRALGECGIAALQKKISDELEIEPGVAGQILEQVILRTNLSGEHIDPGLRARIHTLQSQYNDRLTDELQASFSYAGHRYPDCAVDRLFVLGGGASISGLCEQLASRLNVVVKPMRPSELAECPPALLEKCQSPLLIPALGLAQYEQ